MAMEIFEVADEDLSIPEMDGYPATPAGEALVAQAEMVRRTIRPYSPSERLEFIKARIEGQLDVVGVWHDPSEPSGIRMHPIKSGPVLHAFANGEESASLDSKITNRVFAIPCVDESQALKLQSEFGNYALFVTPTQLRKAIQLGWSLEDPMPSTKKN